VRRDPHGLRTLGLGKGRAFIFLVLEGRADEGGEERVRFERLGFEFRVELAAEEPWVLGDLNDFDVVSSGVRP